MKLSTRNVLKGKIAEIQEGMIMAKIKVDVGNGNILTSVVSVEAVKDLDLKIGDSINALIKSTNVALGKE